MFPGYGAIVFPGWYYHYYAPYYDSQEEKPRYYDNIKTAGEIRVQVKPAGAQVFVDGVKVTEKDADHAYITGVLTGHHTVEVRADGYTPHSQKVIVETAQTTSVVVELEKE
jgi:hypothetical protein